MAAQRDGREVLLKLGKGPEEEIVAIADIPATWEGALRVNSAQASQSRASTGTLAWR